MGGVVSQLSEDAKTFKELTKEGQSPAEGGDTSGSGASAEVSPMTPTPNNGALKNLKVAGLVDPRSPNPEINRTPLEIEERNRRIERTRLKNQFNKENNLTVPQQGDIPPGDLATTPTGPPPGKDLLPAFDPRSPNPEFNRTPISFAPNAGAGVVGRKMFQNQDSVGWIKVEECQEVVKM